MGGLWGGGWGGVRAGSGIPKVVGTGRNCEKKLQHFVIFCNKKGTKRQEPLRKGREPRVKGTGSGWFRPRALGRILLGWV